MAVHVFMRLWAVNGRPPTLAELEGATNMEEALMMGRELFKWMEMYKGTTRRAESTLALLVSHAGGIAGSLGGFCAAIAESRALLEEHIELPLDEATMTATPAAAASVEEWEVAQVEVCLPMIGGVRDGVGDAQGDAQGHAGDGQAERQGGTAPVWVAIRCMEDTGVQETYVWGYECMSLLGKHAYQVNRAKQAFGQGKGKGYKAAWVNIPDSEFRGMKLEGCGNYWVTVEVMVEVMDWYTKSDAVSVANCWNADTLKHAVYDAVGSLLRSPLGENRDPLWLHEWKNKQRGGQTKPGEGTSSRRASSSSGKRIRTQSNDDDDDE
jgi:hypothetical protein